MRLLLARVGAGKTELLLNRLAQTAQSNSRATFPKIWVLLPTRRQEDAFRQRLIERERPVYFHVEFFNFYRLYSRLLDIACQPHRQLDDTARSRILRSAIVESQRKDELEYFGKIAHTAGFVRNVSAFIDELKQNLVTPQDFGSASESAKDRDLALIYNAYQEQLVKHNLVDTEGEGWLALAKLREDQQIARDVELLLVDGFDQFNPLQAQLLSVLDARAADTWVTLPTVPARENTVGNRFTAARQQLERASNNIHVEYLDVHGESRHPALRHLGRHSFTHQSPQIPSDGCLTLIEAADPVAEVSALLRQVKRLLLVDGCSPEDILIAVRDWERYGSLLASTSRSYGIPVALHYGDKLSENPAIIALLNLLELSEHDFRRRDLLDTLHSPYFIIPGIQAADVDLLERVSQMQLVVGGRANWLDAIKAAAVRLPEDEEGDTEYEPIDSADAERLASALEDFFNVMTPPAQAPTGDYVRWLENLIGSDAVAEPDDDPDITERHWYTLHMLRATRSEAARRSIVNRDLVALHELKKAMRSLFAAHVLFKVLGEDSVVTWPTFLADLRQAIDRATINRATNRAGCVLITTVADARGLPHRHVFIPGLSEGIFPAPAPEDPLYLDSERRALTSRGIRLETAAERSADEGLFYELIGLARDSLTLSRPTVLNGAPWPESYLWRSIRVLFADAADILARHRVPLGGAVSPVDAATEFEAILAAADGLNAAEPLPATVSAYNWLMEQAVPAWTRVRLGRWVETNRLSWEPHDHYSGRLRDGALIDWAAGQLGPRRVWSATQMNEYGLCGFRFFAKRLLSLEALEEPEDGINVRQRGTINHDILESTYRRLGEQGLSITPENTEWAIETLHEVAAEIFSRAPGKLHFRPTPLWEQEKRAMLRRLEALVRLDFSTASPVLHKKFGGEERQVYRLEMPFQDGASELLPLPVDGALNGLLVRGRIDRIDRQGDRVIIVDYKSGSTKIPTKEMEQGRNFQMMLYLLAARAMLAADGLDVKGGLFWHLTSLDVSGVIVMDEEGDASVVRALNRLEHHIQRGRHGDFTVRASKLHDGLCSHYCEFGQFCRVGTVNRFKPRG
jgi:ATP-dependent helicase/nuclease subunit B